MLLGCLLLAFLATLLLGLLLGARALVDGIKVYLAQHVHLGGQPGLALEREYLRALFLGLLVGLWRRLGCGGLRCCRLRLGLALGRLRGLWLRLGLGRRGCLRGLGLGCRGCFGRLRRCRGGLGLPCLGLGCRRLGFRFGRCRGWLAGLRLACRLRLLCRLLANAVEVYLAQRLEPLPVAQQVFRLRRLLVRLLVLGLLCKHLLSLALDVLVALEGAHERMILLVRDFGVDVCVVLYLAQAFLVLKEVDRRLQSYVQFCQYFV